MMTEREQQLARALLRALKGTGGGQLNDSLLHTSISIACLPPKPSLAEYNSIRDHCDAQGWIIGVASQTTGAMRWSISDKGLAALIELT